MQHAARAVAGPEGAQWSANRFRIGRGPAHRAPATPHPPRPARVTAPRTFAVVTPYDTVARQLALRSGVSGIRRILGCLCLCGRTPPAIRHHNMQPDSGTRSLAADVCLHMPYH